MLFKNLTPVSLPGRSAGWFTSLAFAALLSSVPAMAQNAAPGTAPIQQPSTPATAGTTNQQPDDAAPGTAPAQQPAQQPAQEPAQQPAQEPAEQPAQEPAQQPTQPSSTPSTTRQQTGNAAPGTAPITTHTAAVALAPGKGPNYMNRWDVYGGLAFANGQAGQTLAKRFNMGGGEGQFTYWLSPKLGVAADYRFGAGTTPVISRYYNRVLVMEHIFAGGVQYRGPRNRYVAINYHAFAGGADGIFNHAVLNYPGGSPVGACPADGPGNIGLYCNHIAPWGAVGGSIDFNQGQKLAVRLAPDLTFEHFGTETREFFGISLGVLYRGGRH